MTCLDCGQLLVSLLADLKLNITIEPLALRNKIGPMLTMLTSAAKTAVTTPIVTDYDAANIAAARHAALVADAAAVAALKPTAGYIKELMPL